MMTISYGSLMPLVLGIATATATAIVGVLLLPLPLLSLGVSLVVLRHVGVEYVRTVRTYISRAERV